MFDLLLYTDINCVDATDILRRIDAHQYISNEVKVEIVETLKEATPHCPWDAKDD